MITSTTADRSPARLALLVASEHVETNPLYVPANGLTHCNAFVAAVCARMAAAIPLILANAQHEYLEGPAGQAAGWEKVDAHTAQSLADQGALAVASWANPVINPDGSHGHGHIAILMPSLGEDGVWVAQAGARNFTRDLIQHGFGPIAPSYFIHP